MKITVLSENISQDPALPAEHGLSLFIETEKHTILFDMGQTELFAENAARLGCDLAAVDVAVLSHGHYDHSGGIARFLAVNDHAPLYASRYAFGEYYHGTDRYIGVDVTLKKNHRIRTIPDKLILDDELSLHSCNHLSRPQSMGSFGLMEKTKDGFVADRFLHEQYLLIKQGGKRILFSGCSHKGGLDILSWFRPDVFVGGFHYSSITSNDRLRSAASVLSRYETEYYTCHCTGYPQFEVLQRYMKRPITYLSVGTTVEI